MSNTNEQKLKPCPFCGSDALSGYCRERSFYVACVMQDCEASVDHFSSAHVAADAWNTRAPASPVQEPAQEAGECERCASGRPEEYSRPDGSSFCRRCGRDITPPAGEVGTSASGGEDWEKELDDDLDVEGILFDVEDEITGEQDGGYYVPVRVAKRVAHETFRRGLSSKLGVDVERLHKQIIDATNGIEDHESISRYVNGVPTEIDRVLHISSVHNAINEVFAAL